MVVALDMVLDDIADFGDLSREKKLVLYNNGKYAELMKINCYTDL